MFHLLLWVIITLHVTVTVGDSKRGYNNERIITQIADVERRTGPTLMHSLNPQVVFCLVSE
jgi:hypothetical protein